MEINKKLKSLLQIWSNLKTIFQNFQPSMMLEPLIILDNIKQSVCHYYCMTEIMMIACFTIPCPEFFFKKLTNFKWKQDLKKKDNTWHTPFFSSAFNWWRKWLGFGKWLQNLHRRFQLARKIFDFGEMCLWPCDLQKNRATNLHKNIISLISFYNKCAKQSKTVYDEFDLERLSATLQIIDGFRKTRPNLKWLNCNYLINNLLENQGILK